MILSKGSQPTQDFEAWAVPDTSLYLPPNTTKHAVTAPVQLAASLPTPSDVNAIGGFFQRGIL
jgi:hypothetical protein